MTEITNKNGIFYSGSNFSIPSHMNYGRFLVERLVQYKDKIALINGVTDEKVTYRELARQIVTVAWSLVRRGVKPGEVVAICSENRIEFLVSAVAVFYVGAVATFINIAYKKDELIHTTNISKPKYAFLSPDAYKLHYEVLKNESSIREFFVYPGGAEANGCLSYNELVTGKVDENFTPIDFYGRNSTCLILYSSGTTGLPKGAKITHLSFITISYQDPFTKRDLPLLTVAPWCNTMGFLTLTDFFGVGKTIVFLQKFDEHVYLETIQKYKVGILMLAPPVLVLMSKTPAVDQYDVSSVEVMISGGATLDSDVITLVKTRFPNLQHVTQGYGMTEATGAVTKELDVAPKQGSVGKVVAGLILKVVDVESRKILGPNQSGEICMKGLALFDGYIGKERGDDFDDDGFFKTGDIGYYDEEGYFFIVDRIKELIKYKAWQVSPSEIEAVLLLHPGIKDAAVVGAPDPMAGELPTAFIIKKPGSSITEKEIIDFVAAKVSPWKRLRGGVRFVDEIPKTGSGKILRRALKNKLLRNPTSKL